jgi:hypothetical protein
MVIDGHQPDGKSVQCDDVDDADDADISRVRVDKCSVALM